MGFDNFGDMEPSGIFQNYANQPIVLRWDDL